MMESFQRIYAMVLRHLYILRGSPTRLIEIIYWPAIQMVLWGFISRYFAFKDVSTLNYALGTLLGAVILWDFLFRTQIGLSISYLEEVWARNLGHLFVSPLRPYEWWLSMVIYSILRAAAGMVPAALLAVPFYGFSIFDYGLPMVFLFFNLMLMGCWLGFVITAVLIKAGPGAEMLAWAFTFLLAPFCAVYYPVSVLPEWLQAFSAALPASHVFEALRSLVQFGALETAGMWKAFGLNIAYMIVSLFILQAAFDSARRAGTLLQTGE